MIDRLVISRAEVKAVGSLFGLYHDVLPRPIRWTVVTFVLLPCVQTAFAHGFLYAQVLFCLKSNRYLGTFSVERKLLVCAPGGDDVSVKGLSAAHGSAPALVPAWHLGCTPAVLISYGALSSQAAQQAPTLAGSQRAAGCGRSFTPPAERVLRRQMSAGQQCAKRGAGCERQPRAARVITIFGLIPGAAPNLTRRLHLVLSALI